MFVYPSISLFVCVSIHLSFSFFIHPSIRLFSATCFRLNCGSFSLSRDFCTSLSRATSSNLSKEITWPPQDSCMILSLWNPDSSLRPLSRTCLKHPFCKATGSNPDKMSKPHQLVSFDEEEGQLCSEILTKKTLGVGKLLFSPLWKKKKNLRYLSFSIRCSDSFLT